VNISTKQGTPEARELRERKGKGISTVCTNQAREVRGEGESKDKNGFLLQKKNVRINKNTACSIAQGNDELSQIKRKEETRVVGKRDGREEYSIHLYRISFFNGFSSKTLRGWKAGTREGENRSEGGAQVDPNTRIITQD
jgi:hypothetical protein